MIKIVITAAVLFCCIQLTAQSYYYKQALQAIEDEDPKKALEYAGKEISTNPEFGDAYLLKAQLMYNDEDMAQIIPVLNKAVQYLSENQGQLIKALCLRAQVYANLNKHDSAIMDINKVIVLDPDNYENYHNRGNYYLELKMYTEAEESYNKALEINDAFFYSYGGLGTLWLEKKDLEQAERYFSKALKISSKYTYGYYKRADINYKLSKYNAAIVDYLCCLELNKSLEDISTLMKYANKDIPFTFSKVNALIKASQDPLYWRLVRGTLYNEVGDYKKSIEDFDYVAEQQSDYHLYSTLLKAVTYSEGGLCHESVAIYRKLLKQDPTLDFLHIYIGDAYRQNGNYTEAIKKYKEALVIHPDDATIYAMVGFCYDDIDKKLAIENYTKALEIDSLDVYSKLCRGRLYYQTDEKEKAVSDMLTVINTDTVMKERGNLRHYAYYYAGQQEKALEWIAGIIKAYPTSNNYYDACCLWALMNEKEKALETLRISFEKGYNSFKHIERDTDLTNIRNTPEFIALVKEYKEKHEKMLKGIK